MSDFPNSLDTDVDLPRVDDNITEQGAEAINALRDAVFNIEAEIGLGASGTAGDIATRLGISLDSAGNIKASALTGLGLVTLPITNSQISATAAIAETKLNLAHNTSDLYNLINNLDIDLNTCLNYINNTGAKVEPHLAGTAYNHFLSHIEVSSSTSNYFKNKKSLLRDNSNLYTLFDDLNKDYVAHQKADGTDFGVVDPTSASVGTVPPDNYAHNSTGIYLNTDNFSFIPQTAVDLQQFAQFIDNSNIFILGTKIQTLYTNGIPRTARASSLTVANVGQNLIPENTPATTYLLNGGSSVPVDDIDTGDDIIVLNPDNTNNVFDAKFSLVRVGDIITVNYGDFTTTHIIKERKFIASGSDRTYLVRINGKNLQAGSVSVKIDRPLFNTEKQGVLALGIAPNSITGAYPSLVVGNPRAAEATGIGFNPDLLDSSHYNLYLQLYPTGNPTEGVLNLPAIDVTGDLGAKPGSYTLDSIVEAINTAFRAPGYNYRFMAYSYKGEIGIRLIEALGGASFSIIAGIVNTSGVYDQGLSSAYTNNVIDVFNNKDALGLGPAGANLASPPYAASYASAFSAENSTKLLVPLTKKNFFINGAERERLNLEVGQILDGYGEGYWEAEIISKTVIAGTRVKVVYQVQQDLSTSGLKKGKTLVVQQGTGGSIVDFGRFVIEDVQFSDCSCDEVNYTEITVYDAVHGTGTTPYASAAVGTNVKLYFSGDSVSFNSENASDNISQTTFKRYFEICIDQNGNTFSHERARFNISGSNITVNGVVLYSSAELTSLNLTEVSPKLRGYTFASPTSVAGIKKITLHLSSYDNTTGTYSGYLCKWNGSTETNLGPVTVGKKGIPVRFYDETYIDYIDIIFNLDETITNFSSAKRMDIQLFSSLSLDEEVMVIGTCQINDTTKKLNFLRDARQFGNVSEKQLSTSALDYISAPTQLLQENGIIRGFELVGVPTAVFPYPNTVSVSGGTAIVNGKIIQVNQQNIDIPLVQETLPPAFTAAIQNITWFLCVNDKAELELIASTDFEANGTLDVNNYSPLGVDHNRIFYVNNPSLFTVDPYPIRATYFSNLVQKYKDVTPIAILNATVSSVFTPSLSYKLTAFSSTDVRRFVGNGYHGMNYPFVLGPEGNFKTLESVNGWLNQLINLKSAENTSGIGSTVLVKGNTVISSAVSLDYLSKVIFKGDNGSFEVVVATGFNLGNNIEFDNIKFNYNFDATATGGFNSANLANFSSACLKSTVSSSTLENLTLKNCEFTCPYENRFVFYALTASGGPNTIENLQIINNKFKTTVEDTEDQDAVIAIVCSNTTTPTITTGSKLINCELSGNTCNKNQMIMISATYNAGVITDALVPIKLQINNNICGSINYCLRQDIPSNSINSLNILDKSNNITINNNDCRYLFVGNSSGFINEATTTNRMVSKQTFYSASATILNNRFNWVHVGERIPTFYSAEQPVLVLDYNKITAYDTSFLNSYWNGVSGLNYAVILDKSEG